MKLTIEVKQEDIDAGSPCRSWACPIALAMDRHLPKFAPADSVAADGEELDFYKKCALDVHWVARTPGAATSFIENFDGGLDVEPFTFEADFEEVKP